MEIKFTIHQATVLMLKNDESELHSNFARVMVKDLMAQFLVWPFHSQIQASLHSFYLIDLTQPKVSFIFSFFHFSF